jgi:hypothetical protein
MEQTGPNNDPFKGFPFPRGATPLQCHLYAGATRDALARRLWYYIQETTITTSSNIYRRRLADEKLMLQTVQDIIQVRRMSGTAGTGNNTSWALRQFRTEPVRVPHILFSSPKNARKAIQEFPDYKAMESPLIGLIPFAKEIFGSSTGVLPKEANKPAPIAKEGL